MKICKFQIPIGGNFYEFHIKYTLVISYESSHMKSCVKNFKFQIVMDGNFHMTFHIAKVM